MMFKCESCEEYYSIVGVECDGDSISITYLCRKCGRGSKLEMGVL